MSQRKDFFEINRQFEYAPSKRFAGSDVWWVSGGAGPWIFPIEAGDKHHRFVEQRTEAKLPINILM